MSTGALVAPVSAVNNRNRKEDVNLAELKRTLRVGTKVTLTHHGKYGPGDTMPWGGTESGTMTLPSTRSVAKAQTNAVAFEPLESGKPNSWLYWPPAREVTFNPDGSFSVKGMTYRIESR